MVLTQAKRDKLFSEVSVGAIALSHRVVMAPMTRMRSNPDDTVSDIMVEHYAQRASEGGLIIMEGSTVSARGNSYKGAPGIHDDRFISGFRRISEAVHANGGFIFAQLYHGGRVSHVSLQPDGQSPIAPSVVPFSGHAVTSEGEVVASPARELRTEEISGIVEEFRSAAERAKAAGFDGVELHSANGYLLDQFLEDSTNRRSDIYGGSIENRTRFLLEVTDAAIRTWGAGRVGVRITPSGEFNEMGDSNPDALFGHLAAQLNKRELAWLHIVEPRIVGDHSKENSEKIRPVASAHLRKFFQGKIIAAGGFTRESAEAILERGDADLVSFGRFFASNPDLPQRLKRNLPLNMYDRTLFYGGTARGYNDYPFHEETVREGRLSRKHQVLDGGSNPQGVEFL
jgi:N-ethylmaleimide reductase